MADREFEAIHSFRSRPSRRQVHSQTAESSAKTVLHPSAAAQPSRADASIFKLQRQFGNRYVQRVVALARSAESDGNVMPDVERAIESSRGGGQSLDRGVQAQMGQALNADFSGVRVHTDAGADGLNQSLSARAFTTGRDIYFRQGEYNPGSSSGRELLAHELTHVVQQNPDKVQTKSDDDASCACGAAPAPGPQMKLSVSQPGDQYEQEADRVAGAVMHQEQQGSAGSSQAQRIHRQMPEEEEEIQTKLRNDQLQRQAAPEEEEEVMGGAAVQKQALPTEEEEAPTT